MELDWNGIRYFAALVEKQTLTAVADELNVRHSTVSRQISQLESALGLRLFDRIGKRYLLTDDGERLYRHAVECCKNIDVLQRVAAEQTQVRHNVTVSAPPLVVRLLLMPHIAAFCRDFLDIRLNLQSGAGLSDLHQRQADIALRTARPTQNDLTVRRLMTFHYRVYAHRDYLRDVPPAKRQFVQMTIDTAHSRWFADLIGDNADIVFASNDFAAVKQAVAGKIGIGVLPDFAVFPADKLQPVSLTGGEKPPALPAKLYLVMHEDVRKSPSVRAVADFLGEVLGG